MDKKTKKDEIRLCRLVLYWSPSFKIRSYKGDNHHEDPMILFSLTSSRIDSIRAQQHLVDYKSVAHHYVKGHVTDQRPPNQAL
jgi:hypothetical protein